MKQNATAPESSGAIPIIDIAGYFSGKDDEKCAIANRIDEAFSVDQR